MAIRTPICDLFGIEHPIVLGGMMGISDGRLTAAVSEAGGLGTLSTATFGPDGTRQEIEKITSLTDRPFSLNLPIFHPMIPELVKLVEKFGVKIVTCSASRPMVLSTAISPVRRLTTTCIVLTMPMPPINSETRPITITS